MAPCPPRGPVPCLSHRRTPIYKQGRGFSPRCTWTEYNLESGSDSGASSSDCAGQSGGSARLQRVYMLLIPRDAGGRGRGAMGWSEREFGLLQEAFLR